MSDKEYDSASSLDYEQDNSEDENNTLINKRRRRR